jgi:hypothetical protein
MHEGTETGMFRGMLSDEQARQAARDNRAITSELAETLAVLVIPALFLSGLNLFLA